MLVLFGVGFIFQILHWHQPICHASNNTKEEETALVSNWEHCLNTHLPTSALDIVPICSSWIKHCPARVKQQRWFRLLVQHDKVCTRDYLPPLLVFLLSFTFFWQNLPFLNEILECPAVIHIIHPRALDQLSVLTTKGGDTYCNFFFICTKKSSSKIEDCWVEGKRKEFCIWRQIVWAEISSLRRSHLFPTTRPPFVGFFSTKLLFSTWAGHNCFVLHKPYLSAFVPLNCFLSPYLSA